MTLHDLLGREVMRFDPSSSDGSPTRVTVPTDDLRAGVYFLRVRSGAEVETRKLVVAR